MSGAYSLLDPGATGGRYRLGELTTSLEKTLQDVAAITRVPAEPDPTAEADIVLAEDGQATFTTTGGNVMVTGLSPEALAIDITDPDNPRALIGQRLDVEGESGLYFHAPAGLRIEIK